MKEGRNDGRGTKHRGVDRVLVVLLTRLTWGNGVKVRTDGVKIGRRSHRHFLCLV